MQALRIVVAMIALSAFASIPYYAELAIDAYDSISTPKDPQ